MGLHSRFEGKTLVELRTHLSLTGELWVSFLSYMGKVIARYRERIMSWCISSDIAFGVVFCGVGTLMYNRYQGRSRDSAWCWYWGHVTSIDIEWILILECWFKLRQCVFSEKPWHPTCVELSESMTLLAMLVLILLVLCAGLWSPRSHKTVSEFIVCLKLFSCLCLFCL